MLTGNAAGKVALVTGANAKYFDLLWSLIRSIKHFHQTRGCDVIVLDVGLGEEQRQTLRDAGVIVTDVGWGFSFITEDVGKTIPPHIKCLIVRPFLPSLFPGYSHYMWLDADTWVQTEHAIPTYIVASNSADIAITPEVHYLYDYLYDLGNSTRSSHYNLYNKVYGEDVAKVLAALPIFNAGVFAARGNSPLWDMWKQEMGDALQRSRVFNCDQVTLNRLLIGRYISAARLSAEYNWICTARPPLWDDRNSYFVAPSSSPQRIEIMHITGAALSQDQSEITCVDGSKVSRSLLCPYPLRR